MKVAKVNLNRVDQTIDGAQAVQAVRSAVELGFEYDIIFTDINMPNMDGLEATKQIRNLYKTHRTRLHGPVIVGITGHIDNDFYNLAIEAGMDMLMAKPLQLTQLT